MGLGWLKKGWRDFQSSADSEDLVAKSSPSLILVSTGSVIVAIVILAYVPVLARVTQIRHAFAACALVSLGGALTYAAFKSRCRGLIGTLSTLLDNAFYSSGLALAAASASEATGMALAVVHGLMIVSFPARDYAITWLFSLAMTVPVFLIVVVVGPSLPVTLVFVASLVMMLIVSQETRVKREDRLRQQRLEQALGAANKLADESVQAALTTTLLTLGHFLHELRNYQTAIAANLEYVEAAGDLDSGPRAALGEAQAAQQNQAELLRRTIEDLRNRSAIGTVVFPLRSTLLELASAEHDVQMSVLGDIECELRGNPEHFRVIMLNLTRNAIQAGARTIECHLRGEASGSAVRLTITDDGSGIVAEKRAGLFDTFALSDKPGGSGLGLYLIRRYVELLGGTIQVGDPGSLGGATFVIRLPARPLVARDAAPRARASA